jgi:hypothetical protein
MTQNINFPLTDPDLRGVLDMDPYASETTSEAENLAQDCYHFLISLPRSNPDAPDRGVGVQQYLSGTTNDLATLPAKIEADFLKDPRIQGCAATLTLEPDGTYLIGVKVEGVIGVFVFSYGYSQAGGLVPKTS